MKEKIALTSIIANVFLAGGKIVIGLISGSAAILASGIDSLADIFSSSIGYAGIRLSKKPADHKHPYGHHKFEVLSGAIITIIVFAGGLGIIYDAYRGFVEPAEIKLGYPAFGIMIISIVVNFIMSKLKIHYGKKENSVSLLSDGIHSRIDVYSSSAILAGLFLADYWTYIDAVLAFLIGLYIIKESLALGKEAADSLLDVSAGEEIEEKIRSIAQAENIKISSLKTQKKGSAITANLEINLPDNLSVKEATEISDNLKKKLIGAIESLEYIAIQISSHELEIGFYKPDFGRSFGWQRRGRFKNKIEEAEGRGPDGYCICDKCDYKTPHQRGIPCSSLKCPNCGVNLKRK